MHVPIALSVALALSPAPAAATLPPPNGAPIEVVALEGSGCPLADTTVHRRDGRTSAGISFRALTTLAGPGTTPDSGRRVCRIALAVTAPAGWTYAYTRHAASSTARLGSGSKGLYVVKQQHLGQDPTASISVSYAGVTNQKYPLEMWYPAAEAPWAPCGTPTRLIVQAELFLDRKSANPETSDALTVETMEFDSRTDFTWKACPTPAMSN